MVLGFQNTSAFEDRLEFVEIFKDAGIGIVQVAYNTQNLAGSGCYESIDSGLSDFGREVVAEMNRVGMLCDLSHVGSVTSRDVIEASRKPVAYTHCLPAGLKEHPRNKTDEELRFIADHGGFIGVTMFPPFLRRGADSTVDDYIEAFDYIIDIAGEDRIGIGTDFTQGHGGSFFEWLTRDKGYARTLTDFDEIKFPDGFSTIGDFPNLTSPTSGSSSRCLPGSATSSASTGCACSTRFGRRDGRSATAPPELPSSMSRLTHRPPAIWTERRAGLRFQAQAKRPESPPSTGSTTLLTYFASSEARNRAA